MKIPDIRGLFPGPEDSITPTRTFPTSWVGGRTLGKCGSATSRC